MKNAVLKRHAENPIITPNDLTPSSPELEIIGVFNPGACQLNDEIVLVARVAEACPQEKGWVKIPVMKFEDSEPRLEILTWKEAGANQIDRSDPRKYRINGRLYLTSVSHLRVLRSHDGVHFSVDPKPLLFPATPAESYGVEDVRITRLDDTYYLTYTAVSGDGHGVGLAWTRDFVQVVRQGMIFPPQNKDACIFPENRYVALHRPPGDSFGKPSIWYAESPDLLHWGNHHCLMRPNDNVWEQEKIGAGPPPIRTPRGWLLLYHGCGRDSVYSLSLCLLDLDNPKRIIKRASVPILVPEASWEQQGFFPNVVFSNGWVLMADGTVKIYYGAADRSICLAETTVDCLLLNSEFDN